MATIPHRNQDCTVCICSECATVDPVTGRSTGPLIPSTTARRHAEYDRLARLLRSPNLPISPSLPASDQLPSDISVQSSYAEQIQSLRQEITERVSTLELSGELRFIYNPVDAGAYEHPDSVEMLLAPNARVTALQYGSHAQSTLVIDQESRFCEIIVQLQKMQDRELLAENDQLQERLFDALYEIHRYKAMEWSQQRSRSFTLSEGGPVIDTGKLSYRIRNIRSSHRTRMFFQKVSTSEPKIRSTFPHRVDDECATAQH